MSNGGRRLRAYCWLAADGCERFGARRPQRLAAIWRPAPVAPWQPRKLAATKWIWRALGARPGGPSTTSMHQTAPSVTVEGQAAERMHRALGYLPRPGPGPRLPGGGWCAIRSQSAVYTLRTLTQGAARESHEDASSLQPALKAYDEGREARQIMMTLRSLRGEQKRAYFETVVMQNKANVFHCNAMLASCASPQQARDLMARMRSLGIAPDVVSYTSLMQLETTSAAGRLGAAEALLEEMKKCEPPVIPNVRTHMVLIEGHGKRGRLEDAVAAWQRMLTQVMGVVTCMQVLYTGTFSYRSCIQVSMCVYTYIHTVYTYTHSVYTYIHTYAGNFSYRSCTQVQIVVYM